MGIKKYKPTTDGRRGMSVSDFAEITRSRPEKTLLDSRPGNGGRNNRGRITVRHRGGGHKRRYRVIDFKRDKQGVPGKVAAIEYDPNRSARIALIHYVDGEKRYILHPLNLEVGDTVVSSNDSDIKPGNAMQLLAVPLGTWVHNIEMQIGHGGQLCRSAGTYAQVMAKEGGYEALRPHFPNIRHAFLIGAASDELAGLLDGQVAHTRSGDLQTAFGQALARAEAEAEIPGRTILLSPACASFDQFADFEARGDAFRTLVEGLP